MRGRARKLAYESISDICAAIRELTFQSHRFQQCLSSILESACGIQEEKGVLQLRIAEYTSTSPIEWAKQMDEMYALLGPNSFLMGKIIDCANNQMSIDVSLLPRCVVDQFPKVGTYESRLVVGLRREVTGSFSIRFWQWFWIRFIRSFLGLNLEQKRTFQQQQNEDQFFFNISHNFYLGLFHKSLTFLSHHLKARLVNLFHVYLIQEFMFKFRKRDISKGEIQVKYKLKSHYFYLLYLLILTNKEIEEETVKIYYQFLEKIAQNYSSTTILTHNQNIRNMIRVWLTLVTRNITVQSVLIDKLKLANDKQGWFRLGRCPIDKFSLSLNNLSLSSREFGRANSAKEGIIKLLDKCNQWLPCYSMLATLEQLLIFEEKKISLEYQREREEQGGILVRAIERILISLMEQTGNKELVVALHDRLNKRIEQLYTRGISLQIDERLFNQANSGKNPSKLSFQPRKLIDNQYPRQINVWSYPLQHNEFLLLYRLMRWIASQVDRILPGQNHEEHPRTNLRIFCNPLVFIITFVILATVLRFA